MPELRRGRRGYQNRVVRFTRAPLHHKPGELLEAHRLSERPDVVYSCSPAIGVADLRELVGSELPPGWHSGAHYMALPNPVLRFRHDDGYRVELHRAASYFGEDVADPVAAHEAWRTLGALLAGAFDEGRLLATPAATGRYLLMRCISGDRAWPVLEAETQELLRATSGQGRVEMFGRTGVAPIVQYDARLAYGALCTGLPAGEPTRDQRDEFRGWHSGGRYRVRFMVPRRWERECECGAPGHAGIGIFPVRLPDGDGWHYPSFPGTSAVTWADAREVAVALRHGWRVQILERLVFPGPPYPPATRANGQKTLAGPLDRWSATLVGLRRSPPSAAEWGAMTSSVAAHTELVNAALRSILLFGIGALHGSPRKVTRTVSSDEAAAGGIPPGATDVLPLGGRFAWTETEPAKWPEMSHPEWTTAIWARARVALLTTSAPRPGPPLAGMLHVPAQSVVACLTDALYLTVDPRWTDDGKAGTYRRVWNSVGAVTLPGGFAELRRVKGSSS